MEITTFLDGGVIGELAITWDLKEYYDVPSDRHPDDPDQLPDRFREVEEITSVEFQLLGKIGIDIPLKYIDQEYLSALLLEEIAEYSLPELAE